MALAAGLDEHDHLIVGVVRDVPSIDQDHLVALVKARHTQIGLKRERRRKTKEKTNGRTVRTCQGVTFVFSLIKCF